jgi:hypothetical protein
MSRLADVPERVRSDLGGDSQRAVPDSDAPGEAERREYVEEGARGGRRRPAQVEDPARHVAFSEQPVDVRRQPFESRVAEGLSLRDDAVDRGVRKAQGRTLAGQCLPRGYLELGGTQVGGRSVEVPSPALVPERLVEHFSRLVEGRSVDGDGRVRPIRAVPLLSGFNRNFHEPWRNRWR